MECGAKKRDKTPCRMSAMPNGRCRLHGGLTPTGIALPQTKTGRYSKNLPARMMARYLESSQDKDILALNEEIALLDARLEDLLSKVDTGECGETWKSLLDTVHAFQEAERGAQTNNEKKKAECIHDREEAIRTIIVLCQEGMADYAAWGEIKSVLEHRRRMVDTETTRRVRAQEMITQERAQLMQGAILDIIRRNVSDRSILATISQEFGSLYVAANGGGA